ncbi:glycine-rich protein [Hymenobacter sp. B81]|uniref:glycine-rich protein n=1 Tax=Hymenobacter sp. B81 TaxID=3344878 RepID=UPI0037DDB77F
MHKVIRYSLALAAALATQIPSQAQTPGSVGIGTPAPDASALLDLTSITKGLLTPRMTAHQRAAIQNPAKGLMVFQTDASVGLYFFDGVNWIQLPSGRVPNALGMVPLSAPPQYDNNAVVSTVAGAPAAGFQEGTGAAARFNRPRHVAVDAAGVVYVADQDNRRIRKILPNGTVSTLAGSGANGSQDGPAASAAFSIPYGVAVDANGVVYVADMGNSNIRKILPNGTVSTLAGSLNQPMAVAVDANGVVYAATSHQIVKIQPNGTASTLAGSGTAGYQDGTGSAARFDTPVGVAVDAAGTVFVADLRNERIRKILPNGTVSTLAGSGTAGYQDGPGSTARFDAPMGVTVDAFGVVYVGDASSGRIRKIQPDGTVGTLAGAGYGYQNGPAASAQFGYVSGVAVASDGGVLYLSDTYSYVIRKVARGMLANAVPVIGNQQLSLTGQQLSLSGANSVTLPSGADNLGNHTATQNLNLADKQLVGNGGSTGLSIGSTGNVGIGISAPTLKLDLAGSLSSTTIGTEGLLRLTRPTASGVKYASSAEWRLGSYATNISAASRLDLVLGNGNTNAPDVTVLSALGNGSVGIGTTAPNAKAALDVSSSTQGFLPPRLSTTQRDALQPAATEKGLLVYNTDTNVLNLWNGVNWSNYLLDSTPAGATTPSLAPVTYTNANAAHTYTVPPGVNQLAVDMTGGKGGGADGGNGGRVQATLTVVPGQVLTIYVGSAGSLPSPGYNMGDAGGGFSFGGNGAPVVDQGGGGGASSDIRIGGTALSNRVLVAGGGGGRGWSSSRTAGGGAGGGLTGGAGATNWFYSGGGGGTQSGGGATPAGSNGTAGVLGAGGAAGSRAGGGGGGYYGGGGSGGDGTNFNGGGGGGGSSYAAPGLTSNVVHTQGFQAGNGYVTITPRLVAPVLDGSNFVNVPGDNLGNHTATQNLNLGTNALVGNGSSQGLGISSGGGVLLPAGVIQRGGAAITGTTDLGLYSRVSGNYMRLVTNAAPIRFYSDDNTGTTPNVSFESNGNVGIGTGNNAPDNRLDVQSVGRSGSHATSRTLYVTGDFNEAGGGPEFRHSNGTQGIGLGYNSLYGAGSNPNQHLNLLPKGNGGVGIGTTTPEALLDVNGNQRVRGALSFGSSTRQMLNLWNEVYGIGVQDGTQYFRSGESFAWYAGGGHSNAQFDAGGGTQQMVLTNGRLGIGTGFSNAALPNGPLEIRQHSPYLVLHSPNNAWAAFGLDVNDSYKLKLSDGPNVGGTNYLTFGQTSTSTNTGGTIGLVGIGTTNPAFPLDVQTSVTPGNFAYGFINGSGSTGYTGSNTGPVSIRAAGRVVATEFNANSDARLKTVVGLSDRAADLSLLRRLRITDYTMRDRVQYGTRTFKKVIAQEVEQVFPQAVSQQAGFLPDVYAVASGVEAQGDSLLRLTLPAPSQARAGQRIKLIGPAGEVIGAVKAASGATLLVRGAAKLAGQQVFVFGLEHPDVRSVDYEALAMLGVSATQELARQLEQLQQQNALLKQQVGALQNAAAAQQTQTSQQLQVQAAQTAELAQRLKVLESLLTTQASLK